MPGNLLTVSGIYNNTLIHVGDASRKIPTQTQYIDIIASISSQKHPCCEVYYNTYSSIQDTASSTEYSSVFIVILGLSGGSYGLLIPVKFGISPRRAFR